jgi:hypothetical protein
VKIIKKHRKLRVLACVAIIISLLCSNIAPAAALALEMQKSQAVWQDVLNADLTEYLGERTPFAIDEAAGGQTEITPEQMERKAADMWLDQSYETDRFIIKYKENAAVTATENALKRADLVEEVDTLESTGGRAPAGKAAVMATVATGRAVTAEELEQELGNAVLREIEYIQPDYEMAFYALDNTLFNKPVEGALKRDIMPKLAFAQPNGITVALLDTGVDTNHSDLAGKLADGYDFVNDSPNVNSTEWYYDQGHGTSMAGAIATGGATVMPLKVFEGGKAYTSDIIAAID